MGALADEYIRLRPDVSRMPREVRKAGADAGRHFGGAFSGAAKKLLIAGAIFAGIQKVTGFLKEANAEARESQKVGATTAQIIKSTGGAAKVTAGQVGALATAISNKTGKDDEAIQRGANLLLTFKRVRNETGKGAQIFDRATAAAVDLSAAGFGSVESSSKTLGKALEDPVRGMTALRRAGVTFTVQQQEQIKTMVESGNVLGAQKLIMAEVESQVGGVAAASATAGEKMSVAFNNFKEQVGTALLPIVDKFANVMISKVFPALSRMVSWLSEKIPAAFDILKAAFAGGGQFSAFTATLKTIGRLVLDTVVPAFVSWAQFMASQWMPIIRQVGTFFMTSILPAFRTVVGFIITNVVPGFLAIVDTVKDLYRVVFPIISQIVGVIIGQFTKMRPQIMSIWNSVKEIITGVMFIIREVIIAVTTIIKLVWDRWGEDIKRIVSAAFKAMFTIVAGLMKAIAGIIKLVVALIKGDWKGAWNAIKQIFSGVWQAIKQILLVVTAAIRAAFSVWLAKLKSSWSTFWTGIKKTGSDAINSVKRTISTVLGQIKTAFANGVTAIGKAWDKVKSKAKEPIEFVVNTVLEDGLLDVFRKISGLVNYTKGESFHIKKMASGGILPGYTPGRDVHRFFSPTGGVIDLSGGEGIARPELARAVGKERWDAANKEAMHGRISKAIGYLGGFFLGGHAPVPGGVSGRHSRAAYPWATWSGDFHAGTGTPVRAWKSGRVAAVKNWNYSYGRHVRINHPGNQQTLYAHLQRAIVRVGEAIGRGRVLGYSNSTGNSTGPHLHFELKSGQGVLGGKNGAGALAPLIDAAKYISQVTSALAKLKDIGGGQFGQMAAAGARLIGDKVKDKITSLVSSFNSANAGSGSGFTSVGGGSNRAIGKRMMLQRWGADQWPPLNALWTKESGWNHRARNPSSGAYGIPQSLPASKMASAGSDWRTNPATQIKWGLGYIASRYGSPLSAWRHSQRTNWYGMGGVINEPVMGLGMRTGARYGFGERGPETVTPGRGGLRPLTIIVDLGDGLRQIIRGEIDDDHEFTATIGRTK